MENLSFRVRHAFGLMFAGLIVLFGSRETQIDVFDFLGTKFQDFRGRGRGV